jgi:hypothetical protein
VCIYIYVCVVSGNLCQKKQRKKHSAFRVLFFLIRAVLHKVCCGEGKGGGVLFLCFIDVKGVVDVCVCVRV